MTEFPHIPGYRIERELGRGGMATVYLGVQESLNRPVAIKVLFPILLTDRQFTERFLKEAETAANLQHSNIVSVFDVGSSGDYYYMTVEYMPGGTLREFVGGRPIGPDTAFLIVKRLAAALHYAHSRGFIHRDVKPENIMFRHDGSPVLTDFGIARAMDSATQLTKTGISIGTPYYMSPEQARGEKLDGRSDIYSLGIVLYEMLTGVVPYDAENTVAVIIKHVQDPVPQLPPHVSYVQPLLEGMLAKDRDERIGSGEELIRLISGIEGGAEEMDGATSLDQGSGYFGAQTLRRSSRRTTTLTGGMRGHPVTEEEPRRKTTGLSLGGYGRTDATASRSRLALMLVGVLVVAVTMLIYLLDGAGKKRREFSASPAPGQEASAVVSSKDSGRVADVSTTTSGASKTPQKSSFEDEREAEYRNYITRARASLSAGDLEDARLKVGLAETLKKGDADAAALKKLIADVSAERNAEEERKEKAKRIEEIRLAEAEAWSSASMSGTESALRNYLMDYPQGRNAPEAQRRLAVLKAKEQEKREEVRRQDEEKQRKADEPKIAPPQEVVVPQVPSIKAGDIVPIQDVDVPPQIIRDIPPVYPESVRRFRIEGTVVINILISETGDVIDARTVRGIKDYPAFERAAESAVRKWRFRPAIKDGVPVKVWKAQTFVFKQ